MKVVTKLKFKYEMANRKLKQKLRTTPDNIKQSILMPNVFTQCLKYFKSF